jgi:predicted deacylase
MAILFGAAIHGNEQGSARFAHHLLGWLSNHVSDFPNFTFYVIPTLNPDGYARARKNPDYWRGGMVGRFNARNVDLNRNFPTPSFQSQSTWGRGKNYGEKIVVNCGPYGASESEMQALIKFVHDKNIQFYFAFHNSAAAVLGNALPQAQTASQAFSAASGYSWESNKDWQALKQKGTAKEWFELQNMPYLEIEGRYRWGSDWRHQLAGIQATLSSIRQTSKLTR